LNLTYQYDWYVLFGNVNLDSFYFIRCIGERNASEQEEYSIINTKFTLNELNGMDLNDITNRSKKFEEYIKTYPIKIQTV
jgi:hypothetical protein